MNGLDIGILIVLGLIALFGFRMGLVGMLVPLVVVVAGLAISSRISGSVGNLFSSVTSNENTQTILAFFVIFVALSLAGAALSFWLRMVLRFIPFFGLANGAAGALVGLAVGFILLSGILTATQKFPVGNMDERIQESSMASFLAGNFGVVMRGIRLIPVDWDARVDGLKEKLPENMPTSLPESLPEGLPRSIPDRLPNTGR